MALELVDCSHGHLVVAGLGEAGTDLVELGVVGSDHEDVGRRELPAPVLVGPGATEEIAYQAGDLLSLFERAGGVRLVLDEDRRDAGLNALEVALLGVGR